jgi:hypothetical protein
MAFTFEGPGDPYAHYYGAQPHFAYYAAPPQPTAVSAATPTGKRAFLQLLRAAKVDFG